MALASEINLAVSQPILHEIAEVLTRKTVRPSVHLDKHLLRLGTYDATRVIKVAEFLWIAQGEGAKR